MADNSTELTLDQLEQINGGKSFPMPRPSGVPIPYPNIGLATNNQDNAQNIGHKEWIDLYSMSQSLQKY